MNFSTLFFGLTSALSWGIADFSGGFATRRGNVIAVVVVSQLTGLFLLGGMALAWREPFPSGQDLWLGAFGGLFGAVGLIALYRGLAGGQMGVFAPITALLTTVIPFLMSYVVEGAPAPRQFVGIAFGLAAIWLLSFSGMGNGFRSKVLAQATFAGTCFGLFFVLIDRLSPGALFWPLAAARGASITMVSTAGLARHLSGRALWKWPARQQFFPVLGAGVFDAGGNVMYALATQAGRLDMAAVLASLYPGATVLLAWLVLKERLSAWQWLGVGAALGAVVLIGG